MSVDVVTYRDAAWAEQTVPAGAYVVMSAARPVRLVAPGAGWPRAACGRGAVSVTVIAGYEPEAVPALLKTAMLLLIESYCGGAGALDEKTEAAARSLCAQFKMWRV